MASDSIELVVALGGEPVTYLTEWDEERTILAIVNRRPNLTQAVTGKSYHAGVLEVIIANDADAGVTVINEGRDKVRFKRKLDDEDETIFTIVKVMQEDAGLVTSDTGLFILQVQA